jgi:tryptophan synthase alpha chain
VLELCAAIYDRVPVLPMIYANVVLTLGPELFATRLAEAGAAGAIVPDLPGEEELAVPEALAERGIAFVPFASPTTPKRRLERLAEVASGFVYVVSLRGVTGERQTIPDGLEKLVEAVRESSGAPAAVGFGIGTPERAAQIGSFADGVIIGTRLVRAVADAEDRDAAVEAVGEFLVATREAMAGDAEQPAAAG